MIKRIVKWLMSIHKPFQIKPIPTPVDSEAYQELLSRENPSQLRCPRCEIGMATWREDRWGRYRQCFNCGWLGDNVWTEFPDEPGLESQEYRDESTAT